MQFAAPTPLKAEPAASAGTIPLLSVAVGLEVAGGLVLLLSEFLEQTIVLRRRGAKGPHA